MTERPNVLFVFPDQLRPDWVGYGDAPVRTPVLDGLLEGGVAFENAVCPAPLCGPSRASLASGMEYDRCGVRNHDVDYPLAAPTLYGRLRGAGYHVVGTGKFDLQKHANQETPPMGTDGTATLGANGFSAGVDCLGKWDAVSSGTDAPKDPYMRALHDRGLAADHAADFERRRDGQETGPTPLPEDAYQDNWIGRQTERLLHDAPEDRPWFCQVNFAGPHSPWDVTERMHGWYRDPPVEFPDPVDPAGELSTEQHQEVRRNYAAMVENVDRWLGRFLEVVEQRGERESTLVVYASDHGELLGDHGGWGKRSPYRASVGVPLVFAGAPVAPRGVVEEPATLLDVHATALDAAGLDTGDVDSRSLWPALCDGRTTPRSVVRSGLGHWRLAFDGRYVLVRGFDPSDGPVPDGDDPWNEATTTRSLREREPLLFDRREDPQETENVAEEHPEVVAALGEQATSGREVG